MHAHVLLLMPRRFEPVGFDEYVSAPQLNVARIPHHFGISFRARGFDQHLSVGIFRNDTDILRCSKRVFFLVEADLFGFQPLLGIGHYRRAFQNHHGSAVFKSRRRRASLVLRVAELKIAGLNQFQKHIGVAIETGSCVVGGAEPVAGFQIGSAKCIEVDDIFGVLNHEFTPLDR